MELISIKKNIFEGEMVLFKEAAPLSNGTAKNSVVKSKKALLDSISDFSLQVRRAMYRKKFKRSKSHIPNVHSPFQKYFEILDYGVLAGLYKNSDQSKQEYMHELYTSGLLELQKMSFPYFLYGSVAWERKRKVWLSDQLVEFLGCESTHSSPCCQQRALNFAERCNVQLHSLKNRVHQEIHK